MPLLMRAGPGAPLTEQLEVINAEQLEEYRRSKGLSE